MCSHPLRWAFSIMPSWCCCRAARWLAQDTPLWHVAEGDCRFPSMLGTMCVRHGHQASGFAHATLLSGRTPPWTHACSTAEHLRHGAIAASPASVSTEATCCPTVTVSSSLTCMRHAAVWPHVMCPASGMPGCAGHRCCFHQNRQSNAHLAIKKNSIHSPGLCMSLGNGRRHMHSAGECWPVQ